MGYAALAFCFFRSLQTVPANLMFCLYYILHIPNYEVAHVIHHKYNLSVVGVTVEYVFPMYSFYNARHRN